MARSLASESIYTWMGLSMKAGSSMDASTVTALLLCRLSHLPSSNKAVYFGHFKNHMREGEGTMLDDAHKDIYTGRWAADKPGSKEVAPLVKKIPQIYIYLQ